MCTAFDPDLESFLRTIWKGQFKQLPIQKWHSNSALWPLKVNMGMTPNIKFVPYLQSQDGSIWVEDGTQKLFVVFDCWNCIWTALEHRLHKDKTCAEKVLCDLSNLCNARKCEENTFGGLPRPSRTEAAEVFSFLSQNSNWRVRKIEIEPFRSIPNPTRLQLESKQRRDIMGHFYTCLRSQEVFAVWSISPRMYWSRVTTWPILTGSQDRTPVGGGFGTKLPIVIDSQTKSGPTFKEKNEGCKTALIQLVCSRILWIEKVVYMCSSLGDVQTWQQLELRWLFLQPLSSIYLAWF